MDQLIVIIIGAALAAFIQGLSGFGFGLTAMSIWAWTLEPRLAAALAVFGAFTGQLIQAATVRRGLDFKRLAPFIAGGLAGLPIGVWILPRLDVPLFKALFGLFVIVICPLMFFSDRLPRITRGGRIGDALSGWLGGLMGGLGGFTGVAPTLWCALRNFEKDVQRSIIQNFNLSMLTITFVTYMATGIVTTAHLPLFAVVAPAVLIPSLLGARIYTGINDIVFRKVVLALLALSGVALLVASVPVLLART